MQKGTCNGLGLLPILLLLSGCIEPAPLPVPPDADSCGATSLQTLVGRPASVLQTMRFGTVTRFLRPGMAVTEDYSASRLNISIDKSGTITAVSCG